MRPVPPLNPVDDLAHAEERLPLRLLRTARGHAVRSLRLDRGGVVPHAMSRGHEFSHHEPQDVVREFLQRPLVGQAG